MMRLWKKRIDQGIWLSILLNNDISLDPNLRSSAIHIGADKFRLFRSRIIFGSPELIRRAIRLQLSDWAVSVDYFMAQNTDSF